MPENGQSVGGAPGFNARGSRPRNPWETFWVAVVAVVFLGLLFFFGAVWAGTIAAPLRWLIIAGLIIILIMLIGLKVNGRLDGALIDPRNKISLSRLQIALWTILVLSILFTVALPRSLPGGMEDLATLAASPNADDQRTLAELKKLSPGKELCFANLSPGEPVTGTAAPAEATITETAALAAECAPDPVGIAFPIEVVTALGISAASFAGSSLVQSIKRNKKVDVSALKEVQTSQALADQAKAEMDAAGEALKEALADLTRKAQAVEALEAQIAAAGAAAGNLQSELDLRKEQREKALHTLVDAQQQVKDLTQQYEARQQGLEQARAAAEQSLDGVLQVNTDSKQANWTDLFRGDEVGNYRLVDMSKVQMFFFTIVLIFAYAAAVYALLQNGVALRNPLGVDMPAFSASMNALLAISHAGYLTVKTVDHTKVQA
jgi:hypothetical protein